MSDFVRAICRSRIGSTALLLAVTVVVYLPVVKGEFLNWDDPVMILENPLARSLDCTTLKKMFTSTVEGNYQPLTFLSYAVEHALVGTAPFLYHLDNLLLHLLNVLLVYLLGTALLKSRLASALTALAFGLHPAHVETVAWITERRNLLATAFSLAALLIYISWVRRGCRWDLRYAGLLALLILGVLSKQTAMAIPLAFLILDRFLGRPIGTVTLLEKAPFFAVSALVLLVNLHAQRDIGALNTEVLGWGVRYALVPLHNLWFYLMKTVLPTGLSAFYPYPARTALLSPAYLASSLIGVILLVIFLLPRFRGRLIWTGFWFYVVTIAPTLRIVPAGNTAMADRYFYLPVLGILWILVSLGTSAWRHLGAWRWPRMTLLLLAAIWFLSLGVQTRDRILVWRSSASLWDDVLRGDPNNFLAHFNRGTAASDAGDDANAEAHFTRAIELKPYLIQGGKRVPDPYLHLQRGLARNGLGKHTQAAEDFRITLEVFPGWPPALEGLRKATGLR